MSSPGGPPPLFESTTSMPPQQQVRPAANNFQMCYNFLTHKNIIALALFITNAVGAAHACSMTALCVTNFIFLFFAALALPKNLPPSLQGNKKVAALLGGYALIAGLIALNVLGLTGHLPMEAIGGTFVGVTLAPFFIEQGLHALERRKAPPKPPVLVDEGDSK